MSSSRGISVRALIASTTLLFSIAAVAQAQDASRIEVFGSIGTVDYLDPHYLLPGSPDSRDGATNYGAGFGFRPFGVNRSPFLRMLGGEFEANATNYGKPGATSTQSFFTGNLLLHGSLGRTEPYLVLGGGVSRESGESHRAVSYGGGFKISITRHIFVRPELRGFYTEQIGDLVRGSIAFGYRW